jgi:serine-type D-Ala-D-Ala carboxypeptidase/endopeptidase (penicillin-binding protein 4)
MQPLRYGSVRAAAAALVLGAATACAGAERVPGPAPAPAQDGRVAAFARLADSIIASPPLDRAHLGMIVYEPATRRVLYEHNADRRFVPASNQKYWPTSTALHELGPDYRYRTPVLGIGFAGATGTARAIVVVGAGDPTFSARFHAEDHTAIHALADSIAAAGVRRVAGDVNIDASRFDDAIIPGTWTYGNLNGTSAPPTGAFVTAEGLFRVSVSATAVGEPARVEVLAPAATVPLLAEVATGAAGSVTVTSIRRGPWDDTLRVTGSIAADAEPRTLRVPMTDPVRFAGHVLADALRDRGVVVEGTVTVIRDATAAAAVREGRLGNGAPPLPVTRLAEWASPPMGDIVSAILQPSQNWIAEQLVRTLGAERRGEGSWRAGISVQNAFLFGTVGIDSAALRLQDGSGMSHQNLVTPRAVAQILDHARSAPWSEVFRAGLARPGEPGTLSSRLTHLRGRMAGKTGTLANVNALSGYVTNADGDELIFVILGNASGLPAAPVVSAMDLLVSVLADPAAPPPQPHALPPGTITAWRAAPPAGFPADANRRNVPPGDSFRFHDLQLGVEAMDTAARPATARLRLEAEGRRELRTVASGEAFNWNGYHVAVVAIPRPGELGAGLVTLEVATVASLPRAVAASAVAGGAELRLRVPHRITHVTLHHTGFPEPLRPGEDPVLRLRNLQSWGASDRLWWDVPYHFLIDLEGRVYEGRDWRYKGDTNTTYEPGGHFLISVLGNYEIQEPTPAQVEAIADLMAWAAARFDVPLDRIGGHYDYAATSCPGPHFRRLLEDGTFRRLVEERLRRR